MRGFAVAVFQSFTPLQSLAAPFTTQTFLCGFLLLDRSNLPAPQNNVGRITINRILGMQSTLNGGGGVYTAQ
jgi:hypothetical protein